MAKDDKKKKKKKREKFTNPIADKVLLFRKFSEEFKEDGITPDVTAKAIELLGDSENPLLKKMTMALATYVGLDEIARAFTGGDKTVKDFIKDLETEKGQAELMKSAEKVVKKSIRTAADTTISAGKIVKGIMSALGEYIDPNRKLTEVANRAREIVQENEVLSARDILRGTSAETVEDITPPPLNSTAKEKTRPR